MNNLAKEKLKELIKDLSNIELSLDENFNSIVELCANCTGKLIFCGVGKSGIIAQKAFASFVSTGNPSAVLNPLDAMHGDFGIIQENDVVILISHSGNTKELLDLLPSLKFFKVPIISITSNNNSTLAKESNYHLNTQIKKELCPHNLAPTTSTTATLIVLDLIMICLMKVKEFQKEDFAVFHPAGTLGKKLLLKIGHICNDESSNSIVKNSSFSEIVNAISKSTKGVIPVIEENNIVGIISDGDVRRSLDEYGESIFQKIAQELMTQNPKIVDFGELAINVLSLMENYQITAIPVFKNNTYFGIINIHDILKEGLK